METQRVLANYKNAINIQKHQLTTFPLPYTLINISVINQIAKQKRGQP